MNKQKTILVLPGTRWQEELVKKIREMGHRALVVNPAENSPCFSCADGFLQSDIFDYEKVGEYGRENGVDAVMSDECDIAMPAVARYGEMLGVPAIDSHSAKLFTDKFMMREFCKQHGLNYPEYRLCKTADEAVELLRNLGRPLIIKPLDSNSSHGVFKVETEAQIREKFAESMAFSRSEKYVLAERFINGTEFTVDGIKTPEHHYTLAISEKKHFEHNPNIAYELLFSHRNEKFNYDAIRKANDAFVMHSGLRFGFTHAEYKYEDGKFYLIEIAARGGGNMISSVITQYMSGYDTYRYLVDCSLGNIYEKDFSICDEYKDRAAVLEFFETPDGGGKVKEIRGEDYLQQKPDIKQYKLNFKVGDTIIDAPNDSERIGFYIACSENLGELKNVMQEVKDKFSIVLEDK